MKTWLAAGKAADVSPGLSRNSIRRVAIKPVRTRITLDLSSAPA